MPVPPSSPARASFQPRPGQPTSLGTVGSITWHAQSPLSPWPRGERGPHHPVVPADVSGKLRIWDTTQKEHLLKYEYQPFAGKIKDIAWTEDSKRIAVVGEGREK